MCHAAKAVNPAIRTIAAMAGRADPPRPVARRPRHVQRGLSRHGARARAGPVTPRPQPDALYIPTPNTAIIRIWHPEDGTDALAEIVRAVIAFLLLGAVAGPRLAADAHRVATTRDTSAARFATAVDAMVAPDASVVGWEWEIEFFLRHPVVHPEAREFTAWIDRTYNDRPTAFEMAIPADANYAIVGPFAAQTGIVLRDVEAHGGVLVASVANYHLYRLAPRAADPASPVSLPQRVRSGA